MKDYLKEVWYGAIQGLILGGIGTALVWTIGSFIFWIVR